MSYYATTSGRETFARLSHLFFLYKAVVITSTPPPQWDQNMKGIPVCFVDSEPETGILPPPPFFLFANDVEIGNHFVFSVIMNIWCMPSAHVVV